MKLRNDLDAWTDDELDMLGAIGQDPIVLDDDEDMSLTDAELTEWAEVEDIDALDSLTELWTEE